MVKSVVKYFLQGILYIAPLGVTVFVLYEFFVTLEKVNPFDIPGLGLVLIVALTTFVGFIGSYLIGFPVFSFIDKQLTKLPLLRIVYTSVKDLISTFVGKKKDFNQPVLLKLYENSELKRLGFVTDKTMHSWHKKESEDLVTVYVPHSFAISGQLYIVPPQYITPIESNSTDVMKYIISGGITTTQPHEE